MSEMYDWVDKRYNPLSGACSHNCIYCSTNDFKKRFPAIMKKYSGEPRLDENVLKKKVPKGIHFLCSCTDLFASNVPPEIVIEILNWAKIQDCVWIIQTKDPFRVLNFVHLLPVGSIVGTTIETNRDMILLSKAPTPLSRARWIGKLSKIKNTFLTLEPLINFDLDEFLELIKIANPDFVNIGADSKNNNLLEPSAEKVRSLIQALKKVGIEIRKKSNLKRLEKSNE
jgi:DNA repair photolyase